jgi:hypothetical protein
MTGYNGEHVTAALSANALLIYIELGSQGMYLDRDEALELQAALEALLPAMPVDIGTGKETR